MLVGPKREYRALLRERLDGFARDEKRFPGGPHPTGTCTECAYLVVEEFGGVVRGYFHAHNETAAVGDVEGGHDFAITPERFVVDPWIFHYYCESPVLDLENATDRAEAIRRYGPEEHWQKLPDQRTPVAHETKAGVARVLKVG